MKLMCQKIELGIIITTVLFPCNCATLVSINRPQQSSHMSQERFVSFAQ
jgi:hypothetical protein